MDESWHDVELSCGEGSQIKESTHWHCFSLFINQIHHNECVPAGQGNVGMEDYEREDGWMLTLKDR